MPARIFISVDLPAPFSPTRAWTSPGLEIETAAVKRVHTREALADVGHLDQQITHDGFPFEAFRLPGRLGSEAGS